ncbi:hypothetical protein GCM10007877_25440 [Marinibactrum halimedae]|uniref:Flavin reductase like domain-containing protein n=2 Tax=Marinibactrum halimedae TaxID=1444977 RepID=A0AA37WN05_9GAMM|nr:hypothetical protein GCM10007877_25440 [Marinibactrum halimedae]
MFSAGHKRDGTKKDTWANIERNRHCTVHIANGELADEVNKTAKPLAEGESELNLLNHALVKEPHFSLPRLTKAPVAFSAECHDIHLLGNGPQAIIYVEVNAAFVDDPLFTGKDFQLDSKKLNPLARLGGNDYALTGDILTHERP